MWLPGGGPMPKGTVWVGRGPGWVGRGGLGLRGHPGLRRRPGPEKAAWAEAAAKLARTAELKGQAGTLCPAVPPRTALGHST